MLQIAHLWEIVELHEIIHVTATEGSWKLTVILRPPCEMAPADNIVEDEPYDRPGHIIHSTCWRNCSCSAENDWEVDVLDCRVGPLVIDGITS